MQYVNLVDTGGRVTHLPYGSSIALYIHMKRLALLLSVISLVLCSFSVLRTSPAFATDYTERMYPGTTLYPGESIWSPSHNYRLTQQSDGNLVEYSMPGNKPFWASGTVNHPGSVTQMQSDGNLVVYAPGHVAIWSSRTVGHPNSVLFIQNDANVVLYAPGNMAIWATNAMHVSGCTDNSRTQAAQYAQSGSFWEVGGLSFDDKVGTTNSTVGSAVLRYNPATRCAWAVGFGGAADWIYIDRSSDGGRTWQGWLGNREVGLGGSTYTGVFNDSYPYVVRVCMEPPSSIFHCSQWY